MAPTCSKQMKFTTLCRIFN